ncbi:fimbrial biogenesis outer membrane usher protein [Enterobacter chuandaensis]|uniref:fimbria/pilus outer membrane usher protein n=1 Tax=Enterobacter chuandaensis TaxID=2497875 RepID=UPI002076391A|nr:fimbria/pilus outer membrane usher protein [Enterobacter chuandaensis]MCM7587703.1 fimbrial biogenesis outer membrane usher protein [Enterobacter chuandaensis]
MMRNIIKFSPLAVLTLYQPSVTAKETFNLHALEIDNPDQPAADLSAFAEKNGQQPGVYRVTLFVNGERQGEAQDIRFVSGKENKLTAEITPAMLERWGVKMEAFPALSVLAADKPLSALENVIPAASSTLLFNKLQLNVSIPQAAMRASARGYVDPSEWDEGVPAALLNYSLSGSNTWRDGENGSDDNYYANLQSGLNLGAWRLRNYSTWNDDEKGSSWRSINTYIQRDIQFLKGQLTLGDSYTPSDIFDSVQFRGAQLASDDNMLPDSQRGFAPVIRGIAQSNAQVTIRQNGYLIYQSYVAPGAFAINDLYPTSGSGDLTVTIKEADGSERNFIQPFSAVPIMQREGRLKYALTAGKYRSGNSDSDEPQFGQGTAIYGLQHAMTVYGGALYSGDYQSGAVGLGFGLGDIASLSADITAAHTTLANDESHDGQSYRIQYSKDFQVTGTSFTLAAYRYSTEGFYTFQEGNDLRREDDDGWRMQYARRQKLQLDLSQRIGRHGSLFVSGYQQDYWEQDGYERTLSTGWNGNVKGISYSITYSYSDYPENTQPADQQLAFNIQVPLSRFLPNAWASYSINTTKYGDTRQQVGLNGTALADNNLSYSLQQSYTNHGTGSAGAVGADYKGTYGQLTGGYNYDDSGRQVNYAMQGGIVAHPHGVTFSQALGQSLAIVRAPGALGTKVQNNTGVYTDWRGYTVVPWVTPYKKNRIALDPGTLSDDVDIDTAVQTVTPTQGAVVIADFNTHVGRRVLMTLLYRGLPVPFGAQATTEEGSHGIVGDDGQVYLTGVADEGRVHVKWNDTPQCVVHYRLPETTTSQSVITTEQECR